MAAEKAEPENNLRAYLEIFANRDILFIRCLTLDIRCESNRLGLRIPEVYVIPKSLATLLILKIIPWTFKVLCKEIDNLW